MTPSPPEAPRLYLGRTRHVRRGAVRHAFAQPLFQFDVDVDRADAALSGLRLVSRTGLNAFGWFDRDHGARDGRSLRAWVEARLTETGLSCQASTIRLIAFPRVFGYVFNPLSLFLVHDVQGRLEAVVYEVNNTFGESHAYVAPAEGRGVERHDADKVFFVSPFYGADGTYAFRLRRDAAGLRLSIRLSGPEGERFRATLVGRARPLTDGRLTLALAAFPVMTLRVIGRIHAEALKLWIKGVPLRPRPHAPRFGVSRAREASGEGESTNAF